MKRLTAFTAILSLILYPQFIYAQAPIASAVSPQLPADMIGVIAAVKGDVEVVSSEAVGRIADSGAPIFLGDVIRTDDEGHLQILLLDQTVFTIGKNSSLVIDEFVYDPATNDGKIDVRIIEGAFRYISGKIPTHKPDNVDIKLPSGSVGIRGTILYGNVSGSQSKLLLLGPGENNNTQHTRGKITVNNEVNGVVVSEVIKKSGYGSEIKGENVPPTPAYEFSQTEVLEMITPFGAGPVKDDKNDADPSVKPAGTARQNQKARRVSADSDNKTDSQGKDNEGEKGGAAPPARGMSDPMVMDSDGKAPEGNRDSPFAFKGSVGDAAGQTRVDTIGIVDVEMESARFDFETDDLSHDVNDTVNTLKTLEGITQIEDLTVFQSGGAYYSVSAVSMGSGGTFDATIYIDFGAKEIGASGSSVDYHANTSGIGSDGNVLLSAQNYGTGRGDAAFDFALGANTICGSVCTGNLNITLKTEGGSVASSANIALSVNDGSSQSGSANASGSFY